MNQCAAMGGRVDQTIPQEYVTRIMSLLRDFPWNDYIKGLDPSRRRAWPCSCLEGGYPSYT